MHGDDERLPAESSIPLVRVRIRNPAPPNPRGKYVLYWMIAARRTGYNYGLQRAIELSTALDKPLVILEALRVGYRWASDRMHRFVLDGMADNARRLERAGVLYHPYVEPSAGAGAGLLEGLAARACLVVTDDYPCFFLPRMVDAVASRLTTRLEQVDSNGLLPLRAPGRVFTTAHSFRRWLQKNAAQYLDDFPIPDPLEGARLPPLGALPRELTRRYPRASEALLSGDPAALAALPIDHRVPPAATRGGSVAARRELDAFLRARLARYVEERNEPEADVGSRLSPFLHFGHIAAHEVFVRLMKKEGWSPDRIGSGARGGRRGFWGASEATEAFLDQLFTWRELGFNFCTYRGDHDRYESLPEWARETLAVHAGDEREPLYSAAAIESGQTGDPLWNASQMQLVREGRIHNYLRMLWGKKILEWSATPQKALSLMIHLNNKYALDGRDPSSYSGIFWVLGRYDRAWGPERPIFGKVRYMSSLNTARKVRVRGYIARYPATV